MSPDNKNKSNESIKSADIIEEKQKIGIIQDAETGLSGGKPDLWKFVLQSDTRLKLDGSHTRDYRNLPNEHIATHQVVLPDVEGALQEIFPFLYLLATNSRDNANAALQQLLPRGTMLIRHSAFTSGLFSFPADDFFLFCSGAKTPPNSVFRGDFDLDRVRSLINVGSDNSNYIIAELSGAADSGYPISLKNLEEIRSVASENSVPLIIEASHILENASLIQRYETAFIDLSLWEIVREICSLATYLIAGLDKSFGVNTGAVIATNDEADYIQLKRFILSENHLLDSVGRMAVANSVSELSNLEFKALQQLENVEFIQSGIRKAKIPDTATRAEKKLELNQEQREKPENLMSRNSNTALFVTPHWSDDGQTSNKYLEESLSGLLRQTDSNWNWIIVDDGSPCKQALNFLENLRDRYPERIHIVFNRINQGPGHCRNTAVNFAFLEQYPFILFQDADDISHPKRLELVRRIFSNHPEGSVVYSSFQVIDENSQPVDESRLVPSIKEILDSHRNNPPQGKNAWIDIGTEKGYSNLTSTTAVNTDIAYRFPFPLERVSEDSNTWMRYSAGGGDFIFSSEGESKYRIPQNAEGSSSRSREGGNHSFFMHKARVDRSGFRQALKLACENGKISSHQVNDLLVRFYLKLGDTMARELEFDIARAQLASAFNISPSLTESLISSNNYSRELMLLKSINV